MNYRHECILFGGPMDGEILPMHPERGITLRKDPPKNVDPKEIQYIATDGRMMNYDEEKGEYIIRWVFKFVSDRKSVLHKEEWREAMKKRAERGEL